MTLYEFNALDEMGKLQTVGKGTLLDFRKDDVYDINLYQISSFYVEEYIHREDKSQHTFKSFSNPELLDIYINRVDITDLLKDKDK